MKSVNSFFQFVRAILLPAVVLVLLGYVSIAAAAAPNHDSEITAAVATFRSIPKYEGWLVEDGENSNMGGMGHNGWYYDRVMVGDDDADQQMKAMLTFNTAAMPDTARLASAQLKVKIENWAGNPFATLNGLYVDVKIPAFDQCGCGAPLELDPWDFQAPATKMFAAKFVAQPVNGWYTAAIPVQYIPKTGTVQFRLHFYKDDNDNRNWDYISFAEGVSNLANRPKLIVAYVVQ